MWVVLEPVDPIILFGKGDVGKLLLPHIVNPVVKCPIFLCLAVGRQEAIPFPVGFSSGIVIPFILGK